MKALLEFDIENKNWEISEKEQEKLKCAQKGWEMSGFIDSFLDYLIVCAPHIKMDKLAEEILSMYYNKLEEYDLISILQTDLQEVVNGWGYDCYAEDVSNDILDKMQEEYIAKKLEKLTEQKLKKLTKS